MIIFSLNTFSIIAFYGIFFLFKLVLLVIWVKSSGSLSRLKLGYSLGVSKVYNYPQMKRLIVDTVCLASADSFFANWKIVGHAF